MRSWTSWYWLVWLVVALGLGFLVPETLAIVDGDTSTQPLTDWLVTRGLATVAAGVGLWLFVHFWKRR